MKLLKLKIYCSMKIEEISCENSGILDKNAPSKKNHPNVQ
jgi:hypothetical protein